MIDWNRPRHPASALLLSRVGVEHGLAPETSLQGTGLTIEQLTDANCAISAEQELRIIRNLISRVPDPLSVALAAGRRYHLTTHGFWGFAIVSSATGADALALGLRYINLTWAFNHAFVEHVGSHMRLIIDGAQVPSDVRDFLALREMASIFTVGLEVGVQPAAVLGVGLRIPPPPDLDPYVTAFLSRPEFGCPTNHIEFDPAVLDAAMPQADVHTREMAERHCAELLAQAQSRSSAAGQVRAALAERLHETPSMEEIAASLHMSSRTLRRQLEVDGTSFRALVDDVRQHVAEDLLGTGRMSVEEIARRLGYSTTPAFTAAFRRWKGVAPRTYAARGRRGS